MVASTGRPAGSTAAATPPVLAPAPPVEVAPPGNGASPAPRKASGARPRLSKDAYRRRRETLDSELGRLGLRKSQLELAMGTPSISSNFVEMRRVTSELADVERALAEAEDAWLELEELAP